MSNSASDEPTREKTLNIGEKKFESWNISNNEQDQKLKSWKI